jgi:hypothetical protein
VERQSERRDVGISGLDLRLGDHVGAIYKGQEQRDEVMLPFVRAALRSGDTCVCLIDDPDRERFLSRLGEHSDPRGGVDVRRLELRSSGDLQIRAPSAAGGASATWVVTEPSDPDEFAAHEAQLSRFAPWPTVIALCLYDLDRFGGGFLLDVLSSHPKILLGSMVVENPYSAQPGQSVP